MQPLSSCQSAFISSSLASEKEILLSKTRFSKEDTSQLCTLYPCLREPYTKSDEMFSCASDLFHFACHHLELQEVVIDFLKISPKDKESWDYLTRNSYKQLCSLPEEVVLFWLERWVEIEGPSLFSASLRYLTDKTTVLHLLTKWAPLSALRRCVEICPDPKALLLKKDSSGVLAFHLAVKIGSSEKAKFLGETLLFLGLKEILIDKDPAGNTPLHVSSLDLFSSQWLIETTRRECGPQALREKNKQEETPLSNKALSYALMQNFIDHNEEDALEEPSLPTPPFFTNEFLADHFIQTKNFKALSAKNRNQQNILQFHSSYKNPSPFIEKILTFCIEHCFLIEEPEEKDASPPFFNHFRLLQFFIQNKNIKALSARGSRNSNFLHYYLSSLHSLLNSGGIHSTALLPADIFIDFCVENHLFSLLWEQREASDEPPLLMCPVFYPKLFYLYLQYNPSLLIQKHIHADGSHVRIVQPDSFPFLSHMCKKTEKEWHAAILPLLELHKQNNTLEETLEKVPKAIQEKTAIAPFFQIFLGEEDPLEVAWKLYKDAKNYVPLMQHLLFTFSFQMAPEGSHHHTGKYFAKFFLEKESTTHISLQSDLTTALSQAKSPPFKEEESSIYPSLNGRKVSVLGRTLIVKSSDTLWDAYKFAKKGESEETLGLEYTITQIFAQSHLFKSHFPEPQGCYTTSSLPPELQGNPSLSFFEGPHKVYHYKAPPSYFQYLHKAKPSSEEYQKARDLCLTDRVAQLRRGILPVTADIWHHGARLKFVPLTDYLAVTRGIAKGMGRMQKGFLNIKFPNERFSGAADWADFSLLSEIRGKEIRDIKEKHWEKASSLQVHALSELYLTHSLIVLYRLFKQKKVNWQNKEFYTEMATDLKHVFVKIFASYTEEIESDVGEFANARDINWEHMAREISFWIDNSKETGYYTWIENDTFPKELYPNIEEWNIVKGSQFLQPDYEEDRFFRENLGFCEDSKNHDFGCCGGTIGWPLFEKALYKFCTLTLAVAEYKTKHKLIVI